MGKRGGQGGGRGQVYGSEDYSSAGWERYPKWTLWKGTWSPRGGRSADERYDQIELRSEDHRGDASDSEGSFLSGIQRALTAAKKQDVRVRKIDEESRRRQKQFAQYQEELKMKFARQKKAYIADMERLEAEKTAAMEAGHMAAAAVKALIAGKTPVKNTSAMQDREQAWKELWMNTQQALPTTGFLREAISAAGMQPEMDADIPELYDAFTVPVSATLPGAEAFFGAPPGLAEAESHPYAAQTGRDPYMLSPSNRPPDTSPGEHTRRPRSRSRPHPYAGQQTEDEAERCNLGGWTGPWRLDSCASGTTSPGPCASGSSHDCLWESGHQWQAEPGTYDDLGGRRGFGRDSMWACEGWLTRQHLSERRPESREPWDMKRQCSRLERPPTPEIFRERSHGRICACGQGWTGFVCAMADRRLGWSHLTVSIDDGWGFAVSFITGPDVQVRMSLSMLCFGPWNLGASVQCWMNDTVPFYAASGAASPDGFLVQQSRAPKKHIGSSGVFAEICGFCHVPLRPPRVFGFSPIPPTVRRQGFLELAACSPLTASLVSDANCCNFGFLQLEICVTPRAPKKHIGGSGMLASGVCSKGVARAEATDVVCAEATTWLFTLFVGVRQATLWLAQLLGAFARSLSGCTLVALFRLLLLRTPGRLTPFGRALRLPTGAISCSLLEPKAYMAAPARPVLYWATQPIHQQRRSDPRRPRAAPRCASGCAFRLSRWALSLLLCPTPVWGMAPDIIRQVQVAQADVQFLPDQLEMPDLPAPYEQADYVELPRLAENLSELHADTWLGVTVHAAHFTPKHYGVRLTRQQGLVSLICKVRRKERAERPSLQQLVPTVPQRFQGYAAFLAFPTCLEAQQLVATILDLSHVGGSYHAMNISRDATVQDLLESVAPDLDCDLDEIQVWVGRALRLPWRSAR